MRGVNSSTLPRLSANPILRKSPESYLAETEHAVRHLFAGIDYYESLLTGVTPPSQANNMDEVKRYMELAELYFGYSISEATLCGAVLQIAFMGILLFPRNNAVPVHSSSLVKAENRKEKGDRLLF
jgi:hypothetical protein